MFPHLSTPHPIETSKLTELINDVVHAEKIYLLGTALSSLRTESIFISEAPTARHISHYYLLVLVKKNGNSCTNMQDTIEAKCKNYMPVTTIVIDMQEFSNWLIEGHPFASKVYEKAQLIYDAGNEQLPPPKAIDQKEIAVRSESILMQGINKAQEFLAGADLYRVRQQNKLAAFMLHQSAEQALHTLLRVKAGFYANTHSLDRLLQYGAMVSYKLPAVFPRQTEKDERLFQQLQKAYTESRYKEDYNICTDKLLTLTTRVRSLIEVVHEACKNN